MHDTLRRLSEVWAWLPTFRVVAELEHLHGAAARLRTSPSAVSRTVKLLEEQLGMALFTRTGRRIQLTPFGRELLSATQDAMTRLEESLSSLDEGQLGLKGSLRVSSQGRLTTVYVLPALASLRRSHPAIVAHVTNVARMDVNEALANGSLDVAVVFQPIAADGIAIERIGSASNGVYCGEGHPLHGRGCVTVEEVLAHPFAAPEPRDGGPSVDGWPSNLPRNVVLYSSLLDGGIEGCASGELLAVFPDVLVPTFACANALRRVPIDIVPPTEIHAVHRANDGPHSAASLFIAEVARELGRLAPRAAA
jgi:DNA-binding transcriptional LysR family regulator